MKRLKIVHYLLILIFSITASNSYANNHQIDPEIIATNSETVVLDQGQPAPFPGILFSKTKADSVKNELIDKDTCFKTLDLYKANTTLEQQQVTLLLNQNKVLIEAKETEVRKDEISKYVYFGTGILVAILSVYGASKLK